MSMLLSTVTLLIVCRTSLEITLTLVVPMQVLQQETACGYLIEFCGRNNLIAWSFILCQDPRLYCNGNWSQALQAISVAYSSEGLASDLQIK